MLHKSFNSAKCKTSLKLASSRIKLLKNKRQQTVSQFRREISKLLESGQDQTARIRVEHVIREEKTVAAYEFIEVFCELIAARLQIIESQKICPMDLKEAIASVIFASQRCPDVTELSDVRKRLAAKYGKEFAAAAVELRPNSGVSSLMVEKLSVKTPDIETKLRVLTSIATEYGINWEPKSFEEQLKKPQDDRLDGPSSFGAVKIVTEPTISEFSVQGSHSYELATKPPEKEVQSPVIHSVSSTSSSVPIKLPENEVQSAVTYSASSSTSLPVLTKYQTEPKPSEPRYQSTQLESSHSNGLDDSLKSEKWNMEFKDASSAARAAAVSAERANIAARAAAEFASQETGSRPFVTGYSETSQTAQEIASTPKAEKVQADFKDPQFNSSRMKEMSRVSKLSEHHSSEIMHHYPRGKNKVKEEDFEGPRNSSNRPISSSPPSSPIDKPETTFSVADRSSQGINYKQVTKHGQSSSPVMQDDLIEKHSAVSEDDEESEMEEENLMRSNSSHYHRVEEENSVRSNSSLYHRATNDCDDVLSDDNLSFSEDDTVGNNIYAEGIMTHNIGAQSGSKKMESSFKSIHSSIDGNIHSAVQDRKNDFHMRDGFKSYDEIGYQSANQQGSLRSAAVDDHGPDEGNFTNVFSISNDNVVESNLLESKSSDSQLGNISSAVVFDDYGPDDGDFTDVFNISNDNFVESNLFESKSSDSSLHEDSLLRRDINGEPPIERHANSHIFSKKVQSVNAEDVMKDSPPKFNEALSPKYDEPLLPKYDKMDEYHNSDSEDDVDISLHNEEGKSTSTKSVSYPGREGSLNLHNSLDDHIGQGLKLDTITGGFKNKGLVQPPYVKSLPESHLTSEEMIDDPFDRTDHGKKPLSDKFLDEKAPAVESTSLFKDSEHSSCNKLSGRDIYSKKSHDDDDMGQGQKSSRQYSDFSRSKEDPQLHSQHGHSSSDRLFREEKYRKIFNDEDDVEQGFKSSRPHSVVGSSKEDDQPLSPVANRRTRTVAQSRRTKGFSSISVSDSNPISLQPDRELFYMAGQPDTEMETKPTQSRSNDMQSRWNSKYTSKQLKDEDADSLRQMDKLSLKESSESSLHDLTCTVDLREEMKTSGSEIPIRSYKKIEVDIPSPSKSDMKSRWDSKYSLPPEKPLVPPVQADEISSKELHKSPSPVHPTTKGMPESSDGSPSKSDMRNRWNRKYTPSRPSEEHLVPPVKRNESLKKELSAPASIVQRTTKVNPESSDGFPSKSDLRNRWDNKYSASPSSEDHLVSPVQRNESSRKELHPPPSTVQPTTKGMPESPERSPSKSDVRSRWSNKYPSSQPSEKNLAPPVQRNESPKKELHAAPSAASDGSSFKSDAQSRWNNKYVPPSPSKKYVAPPVQTSEVSGMEPRALPPTVQPVMRGMPESPEGSVEKEKPESLQSRQPPSTKPEGIVRSSSGPGAAGVQNVPSDLASAASPASVESPRSPQVSNDSPLSHVHKKLPDYDALAARFRAIKSNNRKR